MILFYILT